MKRYFVLLAVVAVAGCAQDLASIDERIAGNYQLVSIDGDSLPIVFRNDSVRAELVRSDLLMGLNGVYRQIDHIRETRGTTVTTQVDTFTAVWSFSTNNTLTLTTQTQSGPFTFTGAWDGTRTLIFDIDGFDWVFRR